MYICVFVYTFFSPSYIFLFVSKTIASLYKVLTLMHIFTASTIYPYCITIITFAEHFVICSLNVRGLSNTMKRREIFRGLKLKSYAIYFLQEFHCTKEKENWWTSERGFSAIVSSFSSASAGTCILFNNNFEFQILKQFSDPEGRFVIADIKTEGKILTLVNVYAPNDDNPIFFKNVLNQFLSFDCGES